MRGTMELLEQVNEYKRFLENQYETELLEQSRKGRKYIIINYHKLIKFNLQLSEILLDDPEEGIIAIEFAIEQSDLHGDSKDYQVQIKNLPESSKRLVAAKRTSDLNRLLTFEGIIRAKSKALTRTVSVKFECPSCGNIITILQLDDKIKFPTKCGCGRKGKFTEIKNGKTLQDIQKIELEELSENVKGTAQPQHLKVLLKKYLVDPDFESRFNPGAKVKITGILKELPLKERNGSKSVDSDYILEAVHMENIDDDEIDLNISDKEMKTIKNILKRDDHVQQIISSLIPSIYGHDKIKEGILIQLIGGVRKKVDDGTVKRGDIHILVIGDPGSGKSAMLNRIETVMPHARVANGKGASGVGLTAAVIKDEFVGWTFQAGILVLAHKNVAIIDEFDKMSKEDRDQIHEALEQQTVTIAKAGVQARLSCECSLLAGANPKYGRFDPTARSIAEQIELPPTIINRFDLIYPVRDTPEPQKDDATARKILGVHTETCSDCVAMDTTLLRKYLYLAKSQKPTFSKNAIERLTEYYLKIRNSYSNESSVKAVPISARQLEGLIRMSEAYSKLRLSKEVTVRDANSAIQLLDTCLRQIAYDEKSGTIDIDKIAIGMTASERSKIVQIKEIIIKLEGKVGKNISIEDVENEARKIQIYAEEVEDCIEQMKKKGDVFEPRAGFVSRM